MFHHWHSFHTLCLLFFAHSVEACCFVSENEDERCVSVNPDNFSFALCAQLAFNQKTVCYPFKEQKYIMRKYCIPLPGTHAELTTGWFFPSAGPSDMDLGLIGESSSLADITCKNNEVRSYLSSYLLIFEVWLQMEIALKIKIIIIIISLKHLLFYFWTTLFSLFYPL